MDKNAKCGTCIYWDRFGMHEGGLCRESSPMVIVRLADVETVWPNTDRLDWCGKWSLDATKVTNVPQV